MLHLEEIRNDLREIRYYYARKEVLDFAISIVGQHSVVTKARKYNSAARHLPPRLLDLYVNLYIRNYTQERLSLELGFTSEYIQMQHKKLLLFLKEYFENEEKNANQIG